MANRLHLHFSILWRMSARSRFLHATPPNGMQIVRQLTFYFRVYFMLDNFRTNFAQYIFRIFRLIFDNFHVFQLRKSRSHTFVAFYYLTERIFLRIFFCVLIFLQERPPGALLAMEIKLVERMRSNRKTLNIAAAGELCEKCGCEK